MAMSHFLIYNSFFAILVISVIAWVRDRPDFANGDHVHKISQLFILGFIGWILAFSRVIIISLYQVLVLVNAGVDLTDEAAIAAAPVVQTFGFNIIGPLLSGPFEETVRFLLLLYILKQCINPIDRKYAPLIFGLAWGLGEIVVLTLGFIAVDTITLENLLISGYERIFAVALHICFSYIVIYGKFDNKRSLLLSILLHSGINTLVLVMLFETTGLSPLAAVFMIEGVFSVVVILLVFYTRRYIATKEEELASKGIDERWTSN
ncbi:MAG: hypothetical protein ACXAE3_06100 [Candidatus Kariarchaeaceae archaeon]|jgi:hypothetical protein